MTRLDRTIRSLIGPATVALVACTALPADAAVSCGAGLITTIGTNVANARDNLNGWFALDNSISKPSSDALTATISRNPGYAIFNYTDSIKFPLYYKVLLESFLAEKPVRIYNNTGNDCGNMTDLTIVIQVCSSRDLCTYEGPPR